MIYSEYGVSAMRVYDRNMTGASAAEAGRTPDAAKAGGAASSHGAGSSRSGDHVELSDALGRLSRALDTSGGERAKRVEALAALYGAGKYSVDPAKVSHAMVAEAITSGE